MAEQTLSWLETMLNFLVIIKDGIMDGFSVGNMTISLWNIFLGLFFFYVAFKIGRWIRNRLEQKWLLKSNLSKGAREAAASLTWYALIAFISIIALAIAGFNISNLALVAGALSVGIGFGLQNVVNNFISGLILLFERPIKRGDWIIVGNTQGFVKEINIRSTRIQTFDFADVLIPNSELLTNQLTNWTLSNALGRVRIPIGVAYGSDTDKVKTILLNIAEQHPEVVKEHAEVPNPQVHFLKFADSSLEFELRCFISDILNIMRITSEINFAIDKQFKEADIRIPFPQRDLHIISQPNKD
ncbi:mechanosensitive ion channel family protein [Aliikangiella maris]|uniref:Mechanosensitive ion channel domain-containing protein n=2 Tax=Aliikangiella maris TaxID=3162458 RepID=A0ABV3MR11_9GAMM